MAAVIRGFDKPYPLEYPDFLFDADSATKASPGKGWHPIMDERNPLWDRLAEGNVNPMLSDYYQDKFFSAEWAIIELRKANANNQNA